MFFIKNFINNFNKTTFLTKTFNLNKTNFLFNQLCTKKPKPVSIQILESDIEEKFVSGGGKGGQAVNKAQNCVYLVHKPSGITVKCHKTRHLDQNRKIARKILLERLDERINGELSKKQQKIAKIRRRKAKQRYRFSKKEEVKSSEETKPETQSIPSENK